MPPNATKRRKGSRIAGAKREAVLSAIAAGGSDTAIGKQLGVDREAVTGIRASEDGQRVLAQVAEAGEATREEMLRVAGSVMIKGLRRLDETIEHIDPGDVPAALGPSLKMLFATKVEHAVKDGTFERLRALPLEQMRAEVRRMLDEPTARDEKMTDE